VKIKAILTGATGMVGEGVLHEIIHIDFFDITPLNSTNSPKDIVALAKR